MAAVVAADGLNVAELRTHLADRLPDYAQPMFLRLRGHLEMTATFKHTKQTLAREGFDPATVLDDIYFNDRERQTFVPLDRSLYERIHRGQVRFYRNGFGRSDAAIHRERRGDADRRLVRR
jgi:fatty-acyl-CoA synthase